MPKIQVVEIKTCRLLIAVENTTNGEPKNAAENNIPIKTETRDLEY